MSIVFPNTGLTANVSTYTLGTRTWTWTGQGWRITATTILGPTGPSGSSGSNGPTGPTGPGSTQADMYLASIFF